MAPHIGLRLRFISKGSFLGEYPESVGVSRDGGTIYVTNWFSNDLWSIDAESYRITGRAATGDGPRAFGAFVRAVD